MVLDTGPVLAPCTGGTLLGHSEYSPKTGVTFILTAEALVKRLVALTPPPNRHLTRFHFRLRAQREAAPPRRDAARDEVIFAVDGVLRRFKGSVEAGGASRSVSVTPLTSWLPASPRRPA